MATIKEIDFGSIHQIQSGQVILDLRSVVKELVENSVDAGATTIDVLFKNQGLDLIEVQDNGSGISPPNYPSIALKHHTSKLSSYSDISSLQTFGFRGEALASLSALSVLTVLTCLAQDVPKGSKLTFWSSGKLKDTSVVAAQRGTTVLVESLFHSLPVRRRELDRNIKREWQKVIALLHQYACILTNLKLSVSHQPTKGKRILLFSTKGNSSTRENIINIFGAKTMTALVPLDLSLEMKVSTTRHIASSSSMEIHVVGHVSRPFPGEGRQTPDRQMFFVNGRPCALPQFAKAFNEVYRSYSSSHTPFILADIRLDTNLYDVNVSPDKRTILLHDENHLLDSMRASLADLFNAHDYTLPLSQPSRLARSNPQRLESSFDTVPSPSQRYREPRNSSQPGIVSDDLQESNGKADSSKMGQENTRSNTATPKPTKQPSQGLVAMFAKKKDGSIQWPESSPSNAFIGKRMSQNALDLGNIPPLNHAADDYVLNASEKAALEGLRTRNCLQGPETSFSTSFSGSVRGLGSTADLPLNPAIDVRVYGSDAHTSSLLDQTRDINSHRFNHVQAGGNIFRHTSGSPLAKADEKEEDEEEDGEEEDEGEDKEEEEEEEEEEKEEEEKQEKDEDVEVEDQQEGERGEKTEEESERETQRLKGSSTEVDERALASVMNDRRRPTRSAIESLMPFTQRGLWQKEATTHLVQYLSVTENFPRSLLPNSGMPASRRAQAHAGVRQVEELDAADAEDKLPLIIAKRDFAHMRVAGQFNLGFIIAVRPGNLTHHDQKINCDKINDDELFIIDQHAADEKYNFERLQKSTTMQTQRLVHPKRLQLTALEEEILLENTTAIESNGFQIEIETSGRLPVGSRCRLIALPLSRETTFGIRDLEELICLLGDNPSDSARVPRPSKIRKLLSMRACRSSVMIGKALTRSQMYSLVRHLGELDKPWNCPHGRPTMRHLARLSSWDGTGWNADLDHSTVETWENYVQDFCHA